MLVEEYAVAKKRIMEEYQQGRISEEKAKDELNKLFVAANISMSTGLKVIQKLMESKP